MPLAFRAYTAYDRAACLQLFDLNCPANFAPNERVEYEAFLQTLPSDYEVCADGDTLVGAFGLVAETPQAARLNWILVAPNAQGRGIGSAMITRALERARSGGAGVISIAASHRSAPFFARFGAATLNRITDGWGPGMHRIDMELHV